jgi:hypothetical protein
MLVGNAGQAVFAPAISTRARLIVIQMLPRGAAFAVVFTHRSPGALRQIRSPQPPVLGAFVLRLETLPFGIELRFGFHLFSLTDSDRLGRSHSSRSGDAYFLALIFGAFCACTALS